MAHMDLTCPDCGRTLRYVATVRYRDGRVVSEYECACGYSVDIVLEKGKKE